MKKPRTLHRNHHTIFNKERGVDLERGGRERGCQREWLVSVPIANNASQPPLSSLYNVDLLTILEYPLVNLHK